MNCCRILPPEQPPGPRGGRKRKRHRVVMRAIWFVLVSGCRWEDVPQEFGCSGRTAQRRLREWQELGIWDRFRVHLLTLLRKAGCLEMDTSVIDTVLLRAFGSGARSGPSPVDRRKSGVKHSLLVNGEGVPLVVRRDPANTSDQRVRPADDPGVSTDRRQTGTPQRTPEGALRRSWIRRHPWRLTLLNTPLIRLTGTMERFLTATYFVFGYVHDHVLSENVKSC